MSEEKKDDSQLLNTDPRIKSLVTQIEALFKEYEGGGFVNIISEQGGDVVLCMPDWAGIKVLGGKGVLDFKVDISMNAPEKAMRTLHFIESFRNCAAILLANGDKIFSSMESEGARIVVKSPDKNL